MDFVALEGQSTRLDHSIQKVRSELAHKGSIAQRRRPSRASLRSYNINIENDDDNHEASNNNRTGTEDVSRDNKPEAEVDVSVNERFHPASFEDSKNDRPTRNAVRVLPTEPSHITGTKSNRKACRSQHDVHISTKTNEDEIRLKEKNQKNISEEPRNRTIEERKDRQHEFYPVTRHREPIIRHQPRRTVIEINDSSPAIDHHPLLSQEQHLRQNEERDIRGCNSSAIATCLVNSCQSSSCDIRNISTSSNAATVIQINYPSSESVADVDYSSGRSRRNDDTLVQDYQTRNRNVTIQNSKEFLRKDSSSIVHIGSPLEVSHNNGESSRIQVAKDHVNDRQYRSSSTSHETPKEQVQTTQVQVKNGLQSSRRSSETDDMGNIIPCRWSESLEPAKESALASSAVLLNAKWTSKYNNAEGTYRQLDESFAEDTQHYLRRSEWGENDEKSGTGNQELIVKSTGVQVNLKSSRSRTQNIVIDKEPSSIVEAINVRVISGSTHSAFNDRQNCSDDSISMTTVDTEVSDITFKDSQHRDGLPKRAEDRLSLESLDQKMEAENSQNTRKQVQNAHDGSELSPHRRSSNVSPVDIQTWERRNSDRAPHGCSTTSRQVLTNLRTAAGGGSPHPMRSEVRTDSPGTRRSPSPRFVLEKVATSQEPDRACNSRNNTTRNNAGVVTRPGDEVVSTGTDLQGEHHSYISQLSSDESLHSEELKDGECLPHVNNVDSDPEMRAATMATRCLHSNGVSMLQQASNRKQANAQNKAVKKLRFDDKVVEINVDHIGYLKISDYHIAVEPEGDSHATNDAAVPGNSLWNNREQGPIVKEERKYKEYEVQPEWKKMAEEKRKTWIDWENFDMQLLQQRKEDARSKWNSTQSGSSRSSSDPSQRFEASKSAINPRHKPTDDTDTSAVSDDAPPPYQDNTRLPCVAEDSPHRECANKSHDKGGPHSVGGHVINDDGEALMESKTSSRVTKSGTTVGGTSTKGSSAEKPEWIAKVKRRNEIVWEELDCKQVQAISKENMEVSKPIELEHGTRKWSEEMVRIDESSQSTTNSHSESNGQRVSQNDTDTTRSTGPPITPKPSLQSRLQALVEKTNANFAHRSLYDYRGFKVISETQGSVSKTHSGSNGNSKSGKGSWLNEVKLRSTSQSTTKENGCADRNTENNVVSDWRSAIKEVSKQTTNRHCEQGSVNKVDGHHNESNKGNEKRRVKQADTSSCQSRSSDHPSPEGSTATAPWKSIKLKPVHHSPASSQANHVDRQATEGAPFSAVRLRRVDQTSNRTVGSDESQQLVHTPLVTDAEATSLRTGNNLTNENEGYPKRSFDNSRNFASQSSLKSQLLQELLERNETSQDSSSTEALSPASSTDRFHGVTPLRSTKSAELSDCSSPDDASLNCRELTKESGHAKENMGKATSDSQRRREKNTRWDQLESAKKKNPWLAEVRLRQVSSATDDSTDGSDSRHYNTLESIANRSTSMDSLVTDGSYPHGETDIDERSCTESTGSWTRIDHTDAVALRNCRLELTGHVTKKEPEWIKSAERMRNGAIEWQSLDRSAVRREKMVPSTSWLQGIKLKPVSKTRQTKLSPYLERVTKRQRISPLLLLDTGEEASDQLWNRPTQSGRQLDSGTNIANPSSIARISVSLHSFPGQNSPRIFTVIGRSISAGPGVQWADAARRMYCQTTPSLAITYQTYLNQLSLSQSAFYGDSERNADSTICQNPPTVIPVSNALTSSGTAFSSLSAPSLLEPEWVKDAQRKRRSQIEWENLEKNQSSNGSHKATWLDEVKLKQVPVHAEANKSISEFNKEVGSNKKNGNNEMRCLSIDLGQQSTTTPVRPSTVAQNDASCMKNSRQRSSSMNEVQECQSSEPQWILEATKKKGRSIEWDNLEGRRDQNGREKAGWLKDVKLRRSAQSIEIIPKQQQPSSAATSTPDLKLCQELKSDKLRSLLRETFIETQETHSNSSSIHHSASSTAKGSSSSVSTNKAASSNAKAETPGWRFKNVGSNANSSSTKEDSRSQYHRNHNSGQRSLSLDESDRTPSWTEEAAKKRASGVNWDALDSPHMRQKKTDSSTSRFTNQPQQEQNFNSFNSQVSSYVSERKKSAEPELVIIEGTSNKSNPQRHQDTQMDSQSQQRRQRPVSLSRIPVAKTPSGQPEWLQEATKRRQSFVDWEALEKRPPPPPARPSWIDKVKSAVSGNHSEKPATNCTKEAVQAGDGKFNRKNESDNESSNEKRGHHLQWFDRKHKTSWVNVVNKLRFGDRVYDGPLFRKISLFENALKSSELKLSRNKSKEMKVICPDGIVEKFKKKFETAWSPSPIVPDNNTVQDVSNDSCTQNSWKKEVLVTSSNNARYVKSGFKEVKQSTICTNRAAADLEIMPSSSPTKSAILTSPTMCQMDTDNLPANDNKITTEITLEKPQWIMMAEAFARRRRNWEDFEKKAAPEPQKEKPQEHKTKPETNNRHQKSGTPEKVVSSVKSTSHEISATSVKSQSCAQQTSLSHHESVSSSAKKSDFTPSYEPVKSGHHKNSSVPEWVRKAEQKQRAKVDWEALDKRLDKTASKNESNQKNKNSKSQGNDHDLQENSRKDMETPSRNQTETSTNHKTETCGKPNKKQDTPAFPRSNVVQNLWPHQESSKTNNHSKKPRESEYSQNSLERNSESGFRSKNKFYEQDDTVWKEHFSPGSPVDKEPPNIQISLYSEEQSSASDQHTTIVKNRDPRGYHIVYSSSVSATDKSVAKKTTNQVSSNEASTSLEPQIYETDTSRDADYASSESQSLMISFNDSMESKTDESYFADQSLPSEEQKLEMEPDQKVEEKRDDNLNSEQKKETSQSSSSSENKSRVTSNAEQNKGPDLVSFLDNLTNHISMQPSSIVDDIIAEELRQQEMNASKQDNEKNNTRSVRIVGVVGKKASQENSSDCYPYPNTEMEFEGGSPMGNNSPDDKARKEDTSCSDKESPTPSNVIIEEPPELQYDSWTQTMDSDASNKSFCTNSIGVQTDHGVSSRKHKASTSTSYEDDQEDAVDTKDSFAQCSGTESRDIMLVNGEQDVQSPEDGPDDGNSSAGVLVESYENGTYSTDFPEKTSSKITRYVIKSSSAFVDNVPQKTTTKKTIKRIIRGSESTGEENIVEEVIEEVFSEPPKVSRNSSPKGSVYEVMPTVTRTVHETADGQKYLTTTVTGGAGERTYITDAGSLSAISSREVVVVPELAGHATREIVGAAGKKVTVKSTVSSSGDVTRSSQVVKNMSTTTTTTTFRAVKSGLHPEMTKACYYDRSIEGTT